MLSLFLLQGYATEQFVFFQKTAGDFTLINQGIPCRIIIDADEDEGIRMAADNLKEDFFRVSGHQPVISTSTENDSICIYIGSIESPIIRQLINDKQLSAKELTGKNEKYIIRIVNRPQKGVTRALVIAGSDKRGTIYGIYELSRQMGVSPWYWWADVPTVHRKNVYVRPGSYSDGEPKVKYRGIFLNDEAPALSGWAQEKFGGFNCKFYKKVFELILRLKGNFMWPAMWGNAFYDDDAENGPLANKMGIIMGTSHHEPMALNQQDWKRRGNGRWDYQTNSQTLQKFWTFGMERAKEWEKVVTIGMRGDGDAPMGGEEGKDHEYTPNEKKNIALLKKIVKDQRQIIRNVTGKAAENTPQVWALYKEVQNYYDKGMEVPDDVTLLLCDDNWGNVRKLPDLTEKPRKGGYGMYYHFDYVGAPRNSKWINISPIPRIWEQMHLAYEYGIRQLWIVNVGDLKPMEYPITFFLDMAWNPDQFQANNLQEHTETFCREQFGTAYAKEAARILSLYPKYNRRVTPEMLSMQTYSFNYGEWERVVNEYNALARDADNLLQVMPDSCRNAYEQLVNFPVQACANLYNMYYAQAMNNRLAKVNNPEANIWADRVISCFKRDSLLMLHYNHQISNGKWNHMMDQVHIGYTSWNNPPTQILPEVQRIEPTKRPYTFTDKEGYVSMEAEHYTRANDGNHAHWITIPDFGKTLSGVTTQPVTVTPQDLYLEYDILFEKDNNIKIKLLLAPTLNFNHNKGLSYAISIDEGKEQIVNFNRNYRGELGEWQANPIIESETEHKITAGKHTLRIRPLNAGIVFEKILIDCGKLKDCYLGAPETMIYTKD